ncbi:MAG: accessory factor UbiK family protein [Alphaproteobacteria bacterium]|nr:accessory factor UbiK family protein [Alphaproteobacteria bacterium]
MKSDDRNLKFLDDLANVASGAMRSLGDVREHVKTMVNGLLNEMDIVTREEFERVEALAQKAREYQIKLEKRIAVLEKQIKTGKKKK